MLGIDLVMTISPTTSITSPQSGRPTTAAIRCSPVGHPGGRGRLRPASARTRRSGMPAFARWQAPTPACEACGGVGRDGARGSGGTQVGHVAFPVRRSRTGDTAPVECRARSVDEVEGGADDAGGVQAVIAVDARQIAALPERGHAQTGPADAMD